MTDRGDFNPYVWVEGLGICLHITNELGHDELGGMHSLNLPPSRPNDCLSPPTHQMHGSRPATTLVVHDSSLPAIHQICTLQAAEKQWQTVYKLRTHTHLQKILEV